MRQYRNKTSKKMKVNPLLIIIAFLSSCIMSEEVNGPEKEILQDDSFAYETISTSGINIQLNTQDEEPLKKIGIRIWDKSPLEGGNVIFKAITDNDGVINADYNFPTSVEKVVLEINHIGMPNYLKVPVSSLNTGVVISGTQHNLEPLEDAKIPNTSNSEEQGRISGRVSNVSFQALGSYNFLGVPDFLEDRDQITAGLLEYINASLPEGQPVPEYHPSYLSDESETNINITQEADVWMTFVHEGAGYRNMLGFYTYETGNPPQTVSDIEEVKIAFPNASFRFSGGGLRSGDKVKLGRFQPGTSIGFILLANGWRGEMTQGLHQVYSNKHLNPEPDEDLRHHTVLLWDEENELFLIGFEDLNRSTGSDNDFNDAIIYITSNPVEAISVENVNPIDKPIDADGDGVSDIYDEFPEDPRYAYSYSYPGESTFGTFAFEDQWPGFGDYDFNDLVIDYRYNQFANGTNRMVTLESEFVIKAIGAGFQNGFGIQLDVSSSQISSISGNDLDGDLFELNANGTELGQSKAVIPVSDNVHKSFGTMGFVNTDPNMEYLIPDTIRVLTNFVSPMELSGAGVAPFNPFLVINQTRGREVHLPGYRPTDLVDTDYFGEGNDGSDPAAGRYYKSKNGGLPWGMNLPVPFDYPMEKTSIRKSYNHFDSWVNSDGFSFMDWYQKKPGYRTDSNLYRK